jgi:hypothetical protein
VLDLGALTDAVHVSANATLSLLRLRIPNAAGRHLRGRPSERVRLRVAGIFALWPSVTLARDSRVHSPPVHPCASMGCPWVPSLTIDILRHCSR